MTNWTDQATKTIDQLRTIYPQAKNYTTPATLTANISSRHTPIANPALPFDPNPYQLARDIKTWARQAALLTLGNLGRGVNIPTTVTDQLKLIANTITDLDNTEEQQLIDYKNRTSNAIYRQARTFTRRWQAIQQDTQTDWATFQQPCPQCGGHLLLNRADWHVECADCQNTWDQETIRQFIANYNPVNDTPTPDHPNNPDGNP